MTSELIELLHDCRFRLENMGSFNSTDGALIEAIMEHVDRLRTRAVRDVPELVRYERTVADERQEHFGMVEHRYGEYVLLSQAAEIIAAKDARIKELHDAGHDSFKTAIGWQQRAEAAEGELITIANHLDCEADIDSILHTVREIEADKDIYKERTEAAETKLAQHEAQEPVMWLCVHDDRGSDRAITTSYPLRRDILKADGYEISPLYFSPLAPKGRRTI